MHKHKHSHRQLGVAILCLASQAAAAGTIYKCREGGSTSYHDRPCGPGAVVLQLRSAPAPAPEALQRLARERALLAHIEEARSARAQQAARENLRAQAARKAAAAARRRCDRLRLQSNWAEEDARRAVRAAPDEAERARTRARRQAEALAVECPS